MKKASDKNYNDFEKSIIDLFGNVIKDIQGTESFERLINEYFKANDLDKEKEMQKDDVCTSDDTDDIVQESYVNQCTTDEDQSNELSCNVIFNEMYNTMGNEGTNVKLAHELSEILDSYIFKIYSLSCQSKAQSEIIISFKNVTFGYKWNNTKDVFELVYVGTDNVSNLKEYASPMGYYDKDDKMLHMYQIEDAATENIKEDVADDMTEDTKDVECDQSVQTNEDDINVTDNEITAQSLYKKCNQKKTDVISKSKAALKYVIDYIFANDMYDMYTDDYVNITSLLFPTHKLKLSRYNSLNTSDTDIALYKIFTRADIEKFLKETYKFPKVKVGVDSNGEMYVDDIEKSYIKCYLV